VKANRLNRSSWRILGPWPLRPVLITVTMALYLSGIRNSARIASGDFEIEWLTEGTFVAVLIALMCGLVLQIGVLWQRRFGVRLMSYVVFVLLSSSTMIALRIIVGDVNSSVLDDVPTVVSAVLRLAAAMFLILIITGIADAKLASQVVQTQNALDLTRAQQGILLQGDEFTRRQISGALHDRVQARLIAACLELQLVDVERPAETQRTLDHTIAQLEEIRAVDVRRIARALSPSLSEVDLESALDELALQYEPGMKSTITVDSVIENKETRPSARVLLGAYRIIEQALLNSAGHGAARLCEIDVRVEHDLLELTVKDDGRGFAGPPDMTGFGSTLMTTWAQSLAGSWDWQSGKTAGVVLSARLALDPGHGYTKKVTNMWL
jgi:two-component system sensor histidine kinase UhpB